MQTFLTPSATETASSVPHYHIPNLAGKRRPAKSTMLQARSVKAFVGPAQNWRIHAVLLLQEVCHRAGLLKPLKPQRVLSSK